MSHSYDRSSIIAEQLSSLTVVQVAASLIDSVDAGVLDAMFGLLTPESTTNRWGKDIDNDIMTAKSPLPISASLEEGDPHFLVSDCR